MIDKLVNYVIRLIEPFCVLENDDVLRFVEESVRHLYVISGKSNNRKNGDAVELSLCEQQWVKLDAQFRLLSKMIDDDCIWWSYRTDAIGETYEEHARHEAYKKLLEDLAESCKKDRDTIGYMMVKL